MNIIRKFFPTIAVLVIGTSILAPIPAYAAGNTNTNSNFFSGLIQFIATKFGLDQSQVKTAIQSYQAQRKATITPRPTMSAQQMQDRQKTRLDALVTQGKITSSQEQAIVTELNTLMTTYNPANLKNETPAQRKQDFTNEQNALKTWASSQTPPIDPTLIMPGFGMRMGIGGPRGRGGSGRWGQHPSVTPTPGS